MVDAELGVKMIQAVESQKSLHAVNQRSFNKPVVKGLIVSPHTVKKQMPPCKRYGPGLQHKLVTRYCAGIVALDDMTFAHRKGAKRRVGAKELPLTVHHTQVGAKNLPAHTGIQFIHKALERRSLSHCLIIGGQRRSGLPLKGMALVKWLISAQQRNGSVVLRHNAALVRYRPEGQAPS